MATELTLREITLRLSGLVHASLGGRLRGREIVAELRAIADWIEGGTKPATPAKEEVHTQREQEIFQYWQARCGKARARFTPERREKIRARLREGYDVAFIKRAIDGCHASPFHGGENSNGTSYNDITLICRNGSKLEQFNELGRELATRPLATTSSEETDDRIQRLVRDAEESLKKGDVNAYNRAQQEIKKLGGDGRSGGDVPGGQGTEAARSRRAAQAG